MMQSTDVIAELRAVVEAGPKDRIVPRSKRVQAFKQVRQSHCCYNKRISQPGDFTRRPDFEKLVTGCWQRDKFAGG